MSWLAPPEKASKMMVARCTRRLATVVAVLNLRNTICCRSLITTFAAEPAMATLLVLPHPGKSAESSKSAHSVGGCFRFPCLADALQQLGQQRQVGGVAAAPGAVEVGGGPAEHAEDVVLADIEPGVDRRCAALQQQAFEVQVIDSDGAVCFALHGDEVRGQARGLRTPPAQRTCHRRRGGT